MFIPMGIIFVMLFSGGYAAGKTGLGAGAAQSLLSSVSQQAPTAPATK